MNVICIYCNVNGFYLIKWSYFRCNCYIFLRWSISNDCWRAATEGLDSKHPVPSHWLRGRQGDPRIFARWQRERLIVARQTGRRVQVWWRSRWRQVSQALALTKLRWWSSRMLFPIAVWNVAQGKTVKRSNACIAHIKACFFIGIWGVR